jgi:Mg2+ and Co2+ transporter CorA
MEQKLYGYLQFEQQLLQEMIRLATRQQQALVGYHLSELSEITSFQEALVKNIRQAEDKRIALLMQWLGISKREATMLKLSSLENKFKNGEVAENMKHIQRNIKEMVTQLNTLNKTNRLLTNRARQNVKEMMNYITGGKEAINVAV